MTTDKPSGDAAPSISALDLASGVERTAEILLERYGAETVAFATSHILPLEQTGATESAEHWRLVVVELKRLRAA